MKKLFLILFVLFFYSCEENDIDSNGPGAEEFAQKISSGDYNQNSADPLPFFKPQDIPIFLDYGNNFKEIPSFPVNPVSSLFINPKLLGECMLWTIEAIRINPETSNSLIYPSLVPVLVKEELIEDETVFIRLNQSERLRAYQLYSVWWKLSEDQPFEEIRKINPLEGSGYRWR